VRPYLEYSTHTNKRLGEWLKCEALSSNPNTTKGGNKKKKSLTGALDFQGLQKKWHNFLSGMFQVGYLPNPNPSETGVFV
jgi:hypothetical protein